MNDRRKLQGGIYLVVDPQIQEVILIEKLKEVLKSNQIAAVQIWDNFKNYESRIPIIDKICKLCHTKSVPVILNNAWELLELTDADGVHFDEIPGVFKEIKEAIPEDALVGLTCNNDLEIIRWADKNEINYISFCSIFPSSTANSCALVDFEIIKKARILTPMPMFLSGGIKPANMHLLKNLDFDGIAVISGIMNASDSFISAVNYSTELKKIKNENFDNR